MHLARPRGDDGAMAVFVCLLLVLVLLPATALGLTSYTRSAVQAEKSRSADSGALAGAASIALLDAAGVPADPLKAVSKDGIAFTKACVAANRAAAVDDEVSEDYATPTGCFANYSQDTSLGACAGAILGALPVPTTLTVPTGAVGGAVDSTPLGGVIGGTPAGPTVDRLLDKDVQISLRDATQKLVPALLHNGIRVTMRYRVRGPLDELLGRDTEERTAVSTARRRFKPVIPPDLLPASADALVVETLRATLADLRRLANGGVGADPVGQLPSRCRPALNEVIDDLDDALQVNKEGTDLLTCVNSILVGLETGGTLDDLLRSTDLDCTDQLFRAQLAPNEGP